MSDDRIFQALADALNGTAVPATAVADRLLPVVRGLIADELDRAIREHRTTVAKLSPVERLTCLLVKAEDLVVRAAALREARP